MVAIKTIEGRAYFDGSSSQHSAELRYTRGASSVTLVCAENQEGQGHSPLSITLSDITIPSRLANTQRRLVLPEGTVFVSSDNDQIDALLEAKMGGKAQWLHRLERSAPAAFAALLVTVGLLSAAVLFGLPIAAERIARAIPVDTQNSVSVGTLELLDRLYLRESELQEAEQDRVKALARRALADAGLTDPNVQLRTGIGPNALALPNGTIVLTDELTRLVDSDEELLAVIYHELGHLEHRHILRRVLQNSALVVGLVLLSGDVNTVDSLVALPTAVLDARYSREFELEADGFALAKLVEKGLDVESFAEVMRKLDAVGKRYPAETRETRETGDADGNGRSARTRRLSLFKYFASHPQTADRISLVDEYR